MNYAAHQYQHESTIELDRRILNEQWLLFVESYNKHTNNDRNLRRYIRICTYMRTFDTHTHSRYALLDVKMLCDNLCRTLQIGMSYSGNEQTKIIISSTRTYEKELHKHILIYATEKSKEDKCQKRAILLSPVD